MCHKNARSIRLNIGTDIVKSKGNVLRETTSARAKQQHFKYINLKRFCILALAKLRKYPNIFMAPLY